MGSGFETPSEFETLMAAAEGGCLNQSQVAELAESLDMGDDEIEELYAAIRERGLEVTDDCGRIEVTEPTRVANGELAEATTDAMSLFLREVSRYPLLTADEEKELARRVEAGDAAAKERMVNSNLRLVVSIARRYRSSELTLLDLDPGGHPRPDPGRREVRLAHAASASRPTRPSGSSRRSSARWPTSPARSACPCTSSSTSRGCRAPSASSSRAPSRSRPSPRSRRRRGCRRSGSPWCASFPAR